MSKSGPLIIVEDDPDDQNLIQEILDLLKVKNRFYFFTNGKQALDHLRSEGEQPFLILCNINLPIINGLELRAAIEKILTLKRKSIPFVFFSTTAERTTSKPPAALLCRDFS
jgi:CheY-like chemotaxis protein